MGKYRGFSDEQCRALEAELSVLRIAIDQLKSPDRVLDRRQTGTIRPRPGDVVRAFANDVVVLPHPRSAKGRPPVTILVEGQPVDVLAETGTVNDEERVTVTTLGAMNWYSTGTEWWGSAVGGSSGGGGGGQSPATGSEDGYLARYVFANAASSLVGTTFFGETVAAATTWATAADVPDGNWFQVVCWGAGASGSNGRFQNVSGTSQSAGGGGGGGARRELWFSRADIIDALPLAMTIANTTAAPANSTTQNASSTGLPGGLSAFGDLCVAYGGGGGHQGGGTANSGGGGGAWAQVGNDSTGGSVSGGGAPAANLNGYGGYGAGTAAPTTITNGRPAVGGGGASGGNCNTNSGRVGTAGGVGFEGGGGGGGGGGTDTGTTAAASAVGGEGGSSGASSLAAAIGGGGAGGIAGAPGGAGQAGANAEHPGQSGAGGGGGAGSPAVSSTGGAGGAGGIPGGGGGGGGCGRGANGTAWGGLGGTGGQGLICITVWGP